MFIGLPYWLYTRFWLPWRSKAYYENQKDVVIMPGWVPILGNALTLNNELEKSKKLGDNLHPTFRPLKESIGFKQGTFIIFRGHCMNLVINHVKIIQDLYVTHNRYFDKDPLIRGLVREMTGKSILFADSNESWRARRHALAPAFYKKKLEEMIELAKGCMHGTLDRWNNYVKAGPAPIDLINEISLAYTRILLACAIGDNLDGVEIEFWENGKNVRRDVPFVIR